MNARDPKGNTALHWALMNNEKNIALILVKFGAEIGIKNDEGRTPLSMAQTNGYGSELNKARVVLAPVAPPRSASIKQAPKPYKRGSLGKYINAMPRSTRLPTFFPPYIQTSNSSNVFRLITR